MDAGGILAWLALGSKYDFDNDWQLVINTAVACELMLMTTFLQNTKRRHRFYMHRCLDKLEALDLELEHQLLAASGGGLRSAKDSSETSACLEVRERTVISFPCSTDMSITYICCAVTSTLQTSNSKCLCRYCRC